MQVIDDSATAVSLLDPLRARVLSAFSEPGSASTVAKALGESRQKINYHVRALEELELLKLIDKVPRRGLTERVLEATSKSYVLSPELLGARGAEPEQIDRLSTSYLLAVAARLIREVAALTRRAEQAKAPLSTLTIDAEIRFRSAAERAEFTSDLRDAVMAIASKYHDDRAPDGRWHRLVVAAHPIAEPIPSESTKGMP